MKNKTVSFDTVIITMVIFLLIFSVLIGIASPTVKKDEDKHECTTFKKYREHYKITPMTWRYRDRFKCIQCGKDYKD